MEPIHRRTDQERSGDVHGDAPDRVGGRLSEKAVRGVAPGARQDDRVLQLQLRTGNLKGHPPVAPIVDELDFNEIRWAGREPFGNFNPIEVIGDPKSWVPDYDESIEVGEGHRFQIVKDYNVDENSFRIESSLDIRLQDLIKRSILAVHTEQDRLAFNLALFGEDKGKSIDWIRHTCLQAIHNEGN